MASAKSPFLFTPVPNEQAADVVKSKPVLSRQAFDKLLPELKARAFCITGVELADTVVNVREAIATLPAGGDWKDIKQQIYDDISPWLVTAADPEERKAQEIGVERRAELLLRTHGFQAYNSAAYQSMDAQRDLFPYWQYQSLGDGRVRATHAALDGVVLPASSSFWQSHFPPWEFGCRCQVIPLSPEDVDELREADKELPLEKHRVLDAAAIKKLEDERILIRPLDIANGKGAPTPINVSSAAEKGVKGALQWHPADMRLSMEMLQDRYKDHPDVWDAFADWAKKAEVPELRQTVWEWLQGPILNPIAPAVLPVAPAAPLAFDALLTKLGLDRKPQWAEDASRSVLERAFSWAVKIGGLVVSKETEVELQQASSSQSGDAHEKFLAVCQREKSKLILGQTLSSDSQPLGIGGGASKTHEGVRQDVRQWDATQLGKTLRTQLFRQYLSINGIKGRPPKAVWGGESKEESQVTGALLSSLKNAGLRLTDDGVVTLSERVGLPLERDPGAAVSPAPAAVSLGSRLVLASPRLIDADMANDAIARAGAADLARAFRGALAPVRQILDESESAEEVQARILKAFPDWSAARVAELVERALVAFAANGVMR